MKLKGIQGIIVAAALLIGGYVAVRHMERAVTDAVRETARSMEAFCTVGEVRFSLWNKRLALTDLRLRDGGAVFEAKRLELVIPLELIFDTPEGVTELATEAIFHDAVITSPDRRETIREMRINRLRADPARLVWLLRDKSADGERFLTLLTNVGYAREQSGDIRMDVAASDDLPAYTLLIERTGSAGYDKGSYDSLELSDLRILRQNAEVAALDSLNIAGIHCPSLPTLKVLLGMSAAPDGPEALGMLQELFAGPQPLLEQLRLRNLVLTTPELPLRVAELALDWPSSRSSRHALRLRDFSLATAAIVKDVPGLRLPGLETLRLNVDDTTAHENEGRSRETLSLDLQDVVSLRLDLVLQDAPSREGGDPLLDLYMTRVVEVDLTIRDTRLLAYAGGNTVPPGVNAAEALEAAVARFFGTVFGEQARDLAREQLAAFVRRPGTLHIRFAPEAPVDVLELGSGMADMASALTVTATPGPTPLEQQIRDLFDTPETPR